MRDEALALLMQMHDLALIKPFGAEEQNAVFQGIRLLGIDLGAPPCACGGREPIWDGCAQVHTVSGHKAYADAGSIILRGQDVKEGQSLEVLIFAAEEGRDDGRV